VVANAYIGPRVRSYVSEIEATLHDNGFRGEFMVVQSTGGLYSSADARDNCVRMMESGPAAGVVGTQVLCHHIGLRNAISFDMGGTTAKSGVVLDGRAMTTSQAMIGGYNQGLPLLTEMVDIHEVGTGGGSIASLSASRALRVGPQSAGAMPGPACYGRGGSEPTVTDANLVLGRLSAERFLGGQMRLDVAAAERAIDRVIAQPLGLNRHGAASGILRIAASNMSHAVRGVTTDRGLDIGQFPALVAFGGAGPLHAGLVARELRIGTVIVPFAPGHFSAFGMLLSDFRYDFARSQFMKLSAVSFDEIERQFTELEAEGTAFVKRGKLATTEIVRARAMDMRYVGQEHAVTVDLPHELFAAKDRSGIKRAFDALHAQRYERESPHEEAEIVSIRVTVTGALAKPRLARIPSGSAQPDASAHAGRRRCFFDQAGWVETCPVYRRSALLANNRIAGPALIEEDASTTVLWPGDSVHVDDIGNLIIEIGRS
jgi:N-methylhydantoinase A